MSQRRSGGASMLAGGDAAGAGGRERPMRADARRNYERLVRAAREVLAREGSDASMEAVAKEAGVGVGTLYRHFAKRIDLVEAVYRTDVDELLRDAERAAEELEPWPALASWLGNFVRYARGKRVFLSELQEAFEKNPELKLRSRERINQATALALLRAQQAGLARDDIDGDDLMALVGPMCSHATLSDEQGARLVAMILDGLRSGGGRPGSRAGGSSPGHGSDGAAGRGADGAGVAPASEAR
jgi:AcrR family transcriptional regulator